jgi:hypothetical protein
LQLSLWDTRAQLWDTVAALEASSTLSSQQDSTITSTGSSCTGFSSCCCPDQSDLATGNTATAEKAAEDAIEIVGSVDRRANLRWKNVGLFAPFIYKMHLFYKTGSGQI